MRKTTNLAKISHVILLICIQLNLFAQTAPSIELPDCHGTIHNLHNELDAGKIIVIGWTMPCAGCAPPLLEIHNAILNYAISNPNTVEYWINDDYANTSCNTVYNWCMNNGISNAIIFSSAIMPMSAFGSDGMPKVVVAACADHSLYYNSEGIPTSAAVVSAINLALSDLASGCLLSNNPLDNESIEITISQNPASTELMIKDLSSVGNFSLSIHSIMGNRVFKNDYNQEESAISIDISTFERGIYFISLESEHFTKSERIVIRN